MRILNPLYDTIFKYLMEDRQAAMDLISIILSTKVLALEPQPQETSTALHEIHVYRLDYKAIIRDREGERKTVLIEIQKYNTHDPVSRFRRYLAKAYASRETALSPEGRAEPLPIVTIYILGFRLPEFPCQSIRVENRAYNNITDEPLQVRSRFVELLTHRCYILIAADPQGEAQGDQGAPTAAEKVELEKLRGLFVRRQKGGDGSKALDIPAQGYGGRLQSIVDRLHRASLDDGVLEGVLLEEEILEQERDAERVKRERDEAIREREELAQEREALAQEKETLALNFARTLLKMGLPVAEVARQTGLSEERVRNITEDE